MNNIRPIIDTPAKLAAHFGERMVDMLDSIVMHYERKKNHVGNFKWKAATLAFAFYNAALEGNAEFVYNFDNLLHSNQICIEQQYVEVNEVENCLTWDVAAMMVETNQKIPQYVFNLFDNHVWMAYEVIADINAAQPETSAQDEDGQQPMPEPCTQDYAQPQVKIETKHVNSIVPAFTNEQKQWMLNHAIESGDRNQLTAVKELIKDNLLTRYFADDMAMLNEAESRMQCRERESQPPAIGEYVAHKIVENEIGQVAEGGIGVFKKKQKDKYGH